MPTSAYFDATYPWAEGVHAALMPLVSRRLELRVLYVPRGNAIHTADTTILTPWLELAPAQWFPIQEGLFAEQPFASGSREIDKGPMAIIQAMVNLGHSLGLTPNGTEDRSKEIAALRYHLEDMRKLAGVIPK